jgi:hypothetical protein
MRFSNKIVCTAGLCICFLAFSPPGGGESPKAAPACRKEGERPAFPEDKDLTRIVSAYQYPKSSAVKGAEFHRFLRLGEKEPRETLELYYGNIWASGDDFDTVYSWYYHLAHGKQGKRRDRFTPAGHCEDTKRGRAVYLAHPVEGGGEGWRAVGRPVRVAHVTQAEKEVVWTAVISRGEKGKRTHVNFTLFLLPGEIRTPLMTDEYLCRQFVEKPAEAAKRYGGKAVRLEGTVTGRTKDGESPAKVRLAGHRREKEGVEVECMLNMTDKGTEATFKGLKVGAAVRVQGRLGFAPPSKEGPGLVTLSSGTISR